MARFFAAFLVRACDVRLVAGAAGRRDAGAAPSASASFSDEERRVDVEQHALLPLGDGRVGHDRGLDGLRRAAVLEQPGLHVQLLGGDAQRLGELLQDLRARLA